MNSAYLVHHHYSQSDVLFISSFMHLLIALTNRVASFLHRELSSGYQLNYLHFYLGLINWLCNVLVNGHTCYIWAFMWKVETRVDRLPFWESGITKAEVFHMDSQAMGKHFSISPTSASNLSRTFALWENNSFGTQLVY